MLESFSRKKLMRGVLFALEGIDGAGKTTQAKKLEEALFNEGYQVVRLHEPTNGYWGQKIKDLAINGRAHITAETEMEYFYNDRLEDVKNNITPALENKSVVIMDRYYLSSVAYQGARGLDPDNIENKNLEIAPVPDITIILDITPDAALQRILMRKDIPNHFERKQHLEIVRKIFLEQFKDRPNVLMIKGDGGRSIETVFNDIWIIVKQLIEEIEEKQ